MRCKLAEEVPVVQIIQQWSRKISGRLRLKFEVTALAFERFSMPKNEGGMIGSRIIKSEFLELNDLLGSVRAC